MSVCWQKGPSGVPTYVRPMGLFFPDLIGACDNPPRPEEEYWLTRTNVCDIFTDHD